MPMKYLAFAVENQVRLQGSLQLGTYEIKYGRVYIWGEMADSQTWEA